MKMVKDNTNKAVDSILTLVVGIGVAVMVLILVGSLGGQSYNIIDDDLETLMNQSVKNQTFTGNNLTAFSTGNTDIHANSLVIVNSSKVTMDIVGNFTVDYRAGTILLINDGQNGTVFNATYNHGNRSMVYSIQEGIMGGFNALETTGSYIPIIVIAVVIALILMIILGGIGGAAMKGGGAM